VLAGVLIAHNRAVRCCSTALMIIHRALNFTGGHKVRGRNIGV